MLPWSDIGLHPRRSRQRAMTLVEVVIASVLSVIVTGAVTGFGIYIARMNKSNLSQLKFSAYSRKTIEEIAKVVRYAKRIRVESGGTNLYCVDENNRESRIYYSDDDNNPLTLANNRIYYIADTAAAQPNPVMIGRYISPFPSTPVFVYLDRTSAVKVRFRVGDPTDNASAVFNAETGPGPQGMDIRTAFGPRNSYLE